MSGWKHVSRYQEPPDDFVPCCMGSAHRGPIGCTCWEEELDQPQSPDLQEGPMLQRALMCGDCAFRPDSPERTQGLGHDAEDLEWVVDSGEFQCHNGMAKVALFHHPDGHSKTPEGDDYRPPQRADRSWKADGTPAELCAGWAAHRRSGAPVRGHRNTPDLTNAVRLETL